MKDVQNFYTENYKIHITEKKKEKEQINVINVPCLWIGRLII